MNQLTEEEKRQRDEDWIKKTGTIEYQTLKLCEDVVDGYGSKLDSYEQALEREELFHSWPGYKHDRNALHNAKISLQILLGHPSSIKNQPRLRTLEEALRNTGLEESEVEKELKNCEEYNQKAHNLKERAFYLSDKALELQYQVLTAKQRRGETLTEREKAALEFCYDVKSANH